MKGVVSRKKKNKKKKKKIFSKISNLWENDLEFGIQKVGSFFVIYSGYYTKIQVNANMFFDLMFFFVCIYIFNLTLVMGLLILIQSFNTCDELKTELVFLGNVPASWRASWPCQKSGYP